MAASVRIDDDAFTDARMVVLAESARYRNHYEALGRMAHLWRTCTATQQHVVSEAIVRAHLGRNGPDALVASGLGERVEGGIRVRGTAGRIEWLGKLRANAERGGKANAGRFAGGSQKESQEAIQKDSQEASQTAPLSRARRLARREPDASPPVPVPTTTPTTNRTESSPSPPSSPPAPDDPRDDSPFVRQVLAAYNATPGTTGRISQSDRRMAAKLEQEGTSFELVECALLLGACRRAHGADSAPIRSLLYFAGIIEELRREPPGPGYAVYLRHQLADASAAAGAR